MKRLRIFAAIVFASLLGAAAIAQQTVTPTGVYDLVRNTITAQVAVISQGTLSVTGTSTLTGAVTAPAGITANITGNVTGGVTTGTTGITPASVSVRNIASGDAPARATTDGTDTAPVSTETYVFEMYVPANATITGVALFNGSVASGNVTVGLADGTGAPIAAAKSASTAVSGITAYQRVPFAVAYAAKGPALYYVQVQYDNAIVRSRTHALGNFGCTKQTAQTYGTLTSFTPPTTFTTNICNLASFY